MRKPNLVFIMTIHAAFLLLGAASLLAQDAEHPTMTRYQVDCSKFDDSPGCRSYNEMIEKKDKDLLSSIGFVYHTVVCFRPSEDVFMVLYIFVPGDVAYKPIPANKSVETADGQVGYERYQNGIFEYGDEAYGEWRKSKFTSGVFKTARNTEPAARVDDNEVNYSYSYDNVGKTKTDYMFSARLSTLRFVEKFQASSQKASDPLQQYTVSGHCAEFNP